MNRVVLIVEDDAQLRSGLSRLIEMNGHTAITAATVAGGLEQLAIGPSHLLLDMNLPDGAGTTILRRVREQHLPVKVAVLSGSVDAELMEKAALLGPDTIFRKPPDWDALMSWIAG